VIALRAIILDTWRQSLQQMVFLLMLAVMAAVVITAVLWPEPMSPRLSQRTLTPHPASVSFLDLKVDQARGLVARDLDGDGLVDLALLKAASLQVWRGAGDGTFAPKVSATLAIGVEDEVRDLQAIPVDAAPGAELVVHGQGGVKVYRFEGASLQPLGSGCPGPVSDLAAADLDGDGDLDLVCAGPAARVWLNAGSGAWEGGATLGELQLVSTGDIDGDGDADVVGVRERSVLGWVSQGAELAAPETLGQTRSEVWDLATAHLMGPNKPCAILTSRFERVDVWIRRTTRWVESPASAGNTPEVERILVVDVNGDGQEDLCLFSRSRERSALWPVQVRGSTDPEFLGKVPLEEDAGSLSAVYRVPNERHPRIVGLEGFEGIDIPLHGTGASLFGPEDTNWRELYANSLLRLHAKGEDGKPMRPREALKRAKQVSNRHSALDRHAQLLGIKAGKILYTLSLLLFIGACAGYFPGLLREGGVDLVLARPVSRLQIYLGKFCGGLLLYAVASTVASLAMVLGIGLRFGAYPIEIMAMVPLQVFTAAVMFSILATIGVVTRSTALPLLFGLFFFLAVDTGLGVLIELQTFSKTFGDGALGKSIEWGGVLLPNFDLLKGASEAAAFGLNALALKPLLTATVWLFGFLAIGYFRFRTADY
jgi:ABC-type transport system involved in multi-copper enzyme maturation permease subunit